MLLTTKGVSVEPAQWKKVTANALMLNTYQDVSIVIDDNLTVMKINASQRKICVLVETLLATAVDCCYHVV